MRIDSSGAIPKSQGLAYAIDDSPAATQGGRRSIISCPSSDIATMRFVRTLTASLLLSCATTHGSGLPLSRVAAHPRTYEATRIRLCGVLLVDSRFIRVCDASRGGEKNVCVDIDLGDDPRPERVDPILALRGKVVIVEGLVTQGNLCDPSDPSSECSPFRLVRVAVMTPANGEVCP